MIRGPIRLFVLLFALLLPGQVSAAGVTYTISGIDGDLLRNARAWLGEPPQDETGRAAFVALARSRVTSALQALGHYQPVLAITVDRQAEPWSMQIAVEPGEPVTIRSLVIDLVGEASEDEAFLAMRADPGIAVGETLHHGRYDALRGRLLTLAQRRGYFEAQLLTNTVRVDALAGTADVELVLDGGRRFRFGQLRYDSTLLERDLLAELRTFAPGDPYLQSDLRAFQSAVQRTGFFNAVLMEPLIAEADDGMVPIAVTLTSAQRHYIDLGVGYSTDTEERISVTWRTPRVNRFGHSQRTRVQYSSVNPSGRIDYNIPLTHPLDDLLRLWARTEENEFGDLDSQQDEVGLRRELRSGAWVWGYSLRQLKESWETLGVSRTNQYLLPGASLSSRHQVGSLLDPEAGFSQLYTLEATNSDAGSDVDLWRATGLLRYVYTPFPRHRLVGRTELGAANISDDDRAELAPSLNFFAGGNRSIRGFGYQSIGNEIQVTRSNGTEKTLVVGGDRLMVLSAEYQYYFNDRWRGAVFADGGDAFDDGEFDWNYGAGVGIHFLSPVGAVRIEVANSLSEDDPDWRLHLNIGAEF